MIDLLQKHTDSLTNWVEASATVHYNKILRKQTSYDKTQLYNLNISEL